MTPKWIERQIDEALLFVATQAAFLYAHRRARRVLRKVVVGTAVVGGVGAAAAIAAAGVGAVGLTGGAVAWYRHRAKSHEAVARAFTTDWHTTGASAPPAKATSPVNDAESEPATER